MTKIGDRVRRAVKHIPRLPRKWRVVRNLACTVLLAALFIVPRFDLHPLTLTGAFRRECKANLLGEPEIIWQDNAGVDGEGEKAFLIADDGERYLYGVFQHYGIRGWNGAMIPWEKEGGITLMPFEILNDHSLPGDIVLTLVLLHDVEGVGFGQVDIPLECKAYSGYNGEEMYAEFSETYTVGLALAGDGILRGMLLPRTEYYIEADPKQNLVGYAERAAEVAAIERLTWGGNEFPITIRLYASDGTLLKEESLIYSFPQS